MRSWRGAHRDWQRRREDRMRTESKNRRREEEKGVGGVEKEHSSVKKHKQAQN